MRAPQWKKLPVFLQAKQSKTRSRETPERLSAIALQVGLCRTACFTLKIHIENVYYKLFKPICTIICTWYPNAIYFTDFTDSLSAY